SVCISQGVVKHDSPKHVELGTVMSLDCMMTAVMYTWRRFVHKHISVFVNEHFHCENSWRFKVADYGQRDSFRFPKNFCIQLRRAKLIVKKVQYRIKKHFHWRINSGLAFGINSDDLGDLFVNMYQLLQYRWPVKTFFNVFEIVQ